MSPVAGLVVVGQAGCAVAPVGLIARERRRWVWRRSNHDAAEEIAQVTLVDAKVNARRRLAKQLDRTKAKLAVASTKRRGDLIC